MIPPPQYGLAGCESGGGAFAFEEGERLGPDSIRPVPSNPQPPRQNLLEVIDDRVPGNSILITSQLPTKTWHDFLQEPTIADAILDRILHNTHVIELKGESMRVKSQTSKED